MHLTETIARRFAHSAIQPLITTVIRYTITRMSPQVFQILLSLHDHPLHGYAIIQDIAKRTDGEVRLTASTLYDALARLVEQGLTGDDALRRIAELRRGTPDGLFRSPEADDQCRYVREWTKDR